MAEQEKLRWLLEPPGEGKAHVYVAIGEKTRLSPTVQEALDRLMTALQEEDEVQGFLMNPNCNLREWVIDRGITSSLGCSELSPGGSTSGYIVPGRL